MNRRSTDPAPGLSITEWTSKTQAEAEIGRIYLEYRKAKRKKAAAVAARDAAQRAYEGPEGPIGRNHPEYDAMSMAIAPQKAAHSDSDLLVKEIKQALDAACRRAQA